MDNEKAQDLARRYARLVYWSDEDQAYIGSLPEICGPCCHGDTIAAVSAELDEIAQEWVALAKEGKATLAAPGTTGASFFTTPASASGLWSPYQ